MVPLSRPRSNSFTYTHNTINLFGEVSTTLEDSIYPLSVQNKAWDFK